MKKTLILVLGFLILLATALAIAIKYQLPTTNNTASNPLTAENQANCQPSDLIFSKNFTDTAKITSIIPPAWTTKSKVVNYTALINTSGRVPVYMPASGALFQGSYYDAQGVGHYLLDFQMDCNLVFRLDHISEPVKKITKLLPNQPKSDSRTTIFNTTTQFEAGEIIGYTTGTINAHNWNIGVYQKTQGTSKNFDDLSNFICPFSNYPKAKQKIFYDLVGSFGDAKITSPLCPDK